MGWTRRPLVVGSLCVATWTAGPAPLRAAAVDATPTTYAIHRPLPLVRAQYQSVQQPYPVTITLETVEVVGGELRWHFSLANGDSWPALADPVLARDPSLCCAVAISRYHVRLVDENGASYDGERRADATIPSSPSADAGMLSPPAADADESERAAAVGLWEALYGPRWAEEVLAALPGERQGFTIAFAAPPPTARTFTVTVDGFLALGIGAALDPSTWELTEVRLAESAR
jgi:hypothetical protein